MNKSLYVIFGIIVVLSILVLILGLQLLGSKNQNPSTGNQVACTEEAKICPDGTAVGRTGPNCEFAACPTDEEQIFCTLDALECPDGSYVGREAPDCEFAACPGETEL